jgi:hypothetical protein
MSEKKENLRSAEIEAAYDATNFGNVEKIFNFLKKQNINVTRKQIKDHLDDKMEGQILKSQHKYKHTNGHLVAYFPFEICQIDIFDLSRYETHNNHYKYIFSLVDIFTRQAYCQAMKTKDINDTTAALNTILGQIKTTPKIIHSDNDSSFMGEKFQKLLNSHNIIHDPNSLHDHSALGIIDNFAKRIKLVFAKIFIRTGKKVWITYLDTFLKNYNNDAHSSLDGLSPNEAGDESNYDKVLEINLDKLEDSHKENATKKPKATDIKIGDSVRIRITTNTQFSKSSDAQFSDKVYMVTSVNGKRIELDNGKTYPRHDLLKVNPNSANLKENPITHAAKEKTQRTILRREDIEPANVIRQPRIRKARDILDL